MEIFNINIEEIKEYENNSKLHPKWQIEQIINSIQEFGFNDPIAIDEDNTIIEGHGRYLACRELGYKTIPCIRLSDLNEEQKRAYIIAHNKLTLNTEFDIDKLEYELNALQVIGFDVELTGFDETEIEELKAKAELIDTSDYGEEDLKNDYQEPNKKVCCPNCGFRAERKEFKADE